MSQSPAARPPWKPSRPSTDCRPTTPILEVLSGETHHAAHFRLQVGDAAVNGIFFVLLDADGKIAEVSIFYRTLPAGVALQRNLADAIGMPPWELRTNEE